MRTNTSKRRNRLGAGLASIGLAVSAMVGVNMATASTASATVTRTWPVNTNGVCQWQGHSMALYSWLWNPYSWYCVDVSAGLPAGVSGTYAGGLNIQGWCQRFYGANARTVGGTVWDWQCYK